MRGIWLLLVAMLAVSGCGPDPLSVTTCDEALAREVVYRDDGHPYYAGQAQLVASCEPCHVDTGRPPEAGEMSGGIRWTVDLARSDVASTDRQRAGQLVAYQRRYDLWSKIESNHHALVESWDPDALVSLFHTRDGSPLASLRTPEGRHVMQNWLACRVPIVERTDEEVRPDGEAAIGAIELCEYGPCATCLSDADCDAGWSCSPTDRCTLSSTWTSIYIGLIQPTCAVGGCHGRADHYSGLTLSPTDAEAARAALVGVAATTYSCMATRVVPGDPSRSLLLAKLVGHFGDGTASCGPLEHYGALPYAEDDLAVIAPLREWIAAGALP